MIKEKMKLEHNQDKYTFWFHSFSISILKFLSILSTIPLCIFFFIIDISFFLRILNGNKAVQLFCAVAVAIDFLIVFCNFVTIL